MLNRANLAIAKMCTKEESRYLLNGVYVTPEYTVVTDGHRLVKVATTNADAEQFPNFEDFKAASKWAPFILKRDDALAVCVAIPKERKLWPVRHAAVNESNSQELATNDLSTKHLFKTEHLAGKYPDFDRVVPEKETAAFVAPVNARYLMEMLKAVVDANPDFPRVELRFYKAKEGEDAQAIRLDSKTADEQEWVGVLMPMRITEESSNGKK